MAVRLETIVTAGWPPPAPPLRMPAAWQYVPHPSRTSPLELTGGCEVVVEPPVALRGCDVVADSAGELAAGADLLDELVLPPHDAKVPAASSPTAAMVIDRLAGRPELEDMDRSSVASLLSRSVSHRPHPQRASPALGPEPDIPKDGNPLWQLRMYYDDDDDLSVIREAGSV